MRFKGFIGSLVIIFIFVGFIPFALSQNKNSENEDIEFVSDSKKWEFSASPYGWIAGIDGDMTVQGTEVEIDMSFGDILDVIDFGVMSQFELRRGKIGFYFDPLYLKVSGDEGSSGGAQVDYEIKTSFLDFGVLYRLVEIPLDDSFDSTERARRSLFALDLYGGGRYFYMKTEMDIKGAGPLGADKSLEQTEDFVDPIVGTKMAYYLGKKFTIAFKGDIGGFDVNSDFMWNVQGILGYDFKLGKKKGTFGIGYRALDLDFAEGDVFSRFALDITMSGPLLGVRIVF